MEVAASLWNARAVGDQAARLGGGWEVGVLPVDIVGVLGEASEIDTGFCFCIFNGTWR